MKRNIIYHLSNSYTINDEISFYLGIMFLVSNLSMQIFLLGVRILDGPMTDSLEAMAFNSKMHINDIYSCRLVSLQYINMHSFDSKCYYYIVVIKD